MILVSIRIIEVKLIGSLDLCLCQRQLYKPNGVSEENWPPLGERKNSLYRSDACARAEAMKCLETIMLIHTTSR